MTLIRNFTTRASMQGTSFATFFVVFASVGLMAGCGGDDEDLGSGIPSSQDGGQSDTDAGLASMDAGVAADAGMASRCPDAMPPMCQDESVQALSLRDVRADGVIREEGSVPGELTYVDATAGGLMIPQSYVYARFTPDGLEKVDISDEEAFDDTSWHLAFRRYVIRLNGGVAGPSCVRGARVPEGTTFEALTELPSGITPREEAYLSDSCELINDGSGLPNAPATVLASFWDYPGCVRMTGNLFVIELPDGRGVKLEVLSYYEPDRQQECQDTNGVTQPAGSANLRFRWAFL